MEIGYNPHRVRELTRRTQASIDAIADIGSTDPAATDALRTLRLLRRNLEDHWMPLLGRLERSEAMVSWSTGILEPARAAGAALVTWLTHRDDPEHTSSDTLECGWTRYSTLSDAELLELLDLTATQVLSRNPLDHPPRALVTALSQELALRAGSDDAFAGALLAVAAVNPLVALATGDAPVPRAFVRDLLITMFRSVPWSGGTEADISPHAIATAMESLLDDPSACLDVLLDHHSLHVLARWPMLDGGIVQEFVITGLHDAVVADPQRLLDGHAVLADLVRLTNGPLDGGLQPGMARGVAVSMVGYVSTIAPAIRLEGSYPVMVVERAFEIELGTYDDLVDLFGALLRDAPAQAVLGGVLGAYAIKVVHDLGDRVVDHVGIERVARFADLLGDAARAEQAELLVTAAATEATRRRVVGAIGFGVGAVLSVSGVGSVTRGLATRAVGAAARPAVRVTPRALPDLSIPATTYDLITVACVRLVAADPSLRPPLGLGAITDAEWGRVEELLAAIADTDDPHERARRVIRLNRYAEDRLPALAGYLADIRSTPGMDELTEGRSVVPAD
jgi:hypothetical protein